MAEGDTLPKKRRRLDFSENVTVVVGPDDDNKSFMVHKAVLTKTSDFFNACCSSDSRWQEGVTKTTKLPETESETFEIYLHWLYTHELIVSGDLESVGSRDSEKQRDVNNIICARLQKLAVLADKYGDITFGNVVMDWMIKTSDDLHLLPSRESIIAVYNDLPEGSPVRKLIVDLFHGEASEDALKGLKDLVYPRDFVYEVMMSFKDQANEEKERPENAWENRCDYHIHNDKVPECT